MSLQAMSWVIDYAPHSGSELVILLMLANHAHADGTGAYPSLTTLGKEARMSRRQVVRVIENLEAAGTITVERGASELGTNLYTIVMTASVKLTLVEPERRRRRGDKTTPPPSDIIPPLLVTSAPLAGDIAMSPKPSVLKPSIPEPSKSAREELLRKAALILLQFGVTLASEASVCRDLDALLASRPDIDAAQLPRLVRAFVDTVPRGLPRSPPVRGRPTAPPAGSGQWRTDIRAWLDIQQP